MDYRIRENAKLVGQHIKSIEKRIELIDRLNESIKEIDDSYSISILSNERDHHEVIVRKLFSEINRITESIIPEE